MRVQTLCDRRELLFAASEIIEGDVKSIDPTFGNHISGFLTPVSIRNEESLTQPREPAERMACYGMRGHQAECTSNNFRPPFAFLERSVVTSVMYYARLNISTQTSISSTYSDLTTSLIDFEFLWNGF
jgi:hypothetical protein